MVDDHGVTLDRTQYRDFVEYLVWDSVEETGTFNAFVRN